MSPSKGFFESDDEYKARVAKEADERTIENSTEEASSKGWFESDDSYRSRISREATERRIEDASGSAPSRSFFENGDEYRSRIEREANESTVAKGTGSAPKQGIFETSKEYEVRVRRESNEQTLRDAGSKPSKGWFEGDHEYRSRIAHEAREARADDRRSESDAYEPAGSRRGKGGKRQGGSKDSSSSYSTSSSISRDTPFPTWILVVAIGGALFLAWQWVASSKRAADNRARLEQTLAAATSAAERGNFEEADAQFENAQVIAGQIDDEARTRVASSKAGLYLRIDIPGGASVSFQPLGRIYYSLGNPSKCRKNPQLCGYHFVSSDSRSIFTYHSGLTVRMRDLEEMPISREIRVSELVPLNEKICCAQSQQEAAPRLTVRNEGAQPASVFVAHR
jgi:hypothetical protein